MCGTAKRYFRPRPGPHSLSRQARSGIHSATELTLNIESQTNDGKIKQNGEDEETEQRMKRQSTISQQNEAYGMIGAVKQLTVTQQNEAYGLTSTGTPVLVFSTKQPDTGQESDEYSYVRFQTKP